MRAVSVPLAHSVHDLDLPLCASDGSAEWLGKRSPSLLWVSRSPAQQLDASGLSLLGACNLSDGALRVLSFAGYHALEVRRCSPRPVCLYVQTFPRVHLRPCFLPPHSLLVQACGAGASPSLSALLLNGTRGVAFGRQCLARKGTPDLDRVEVRGACDVVALCMCGFFCKVECRTIDMRGLH
jgi:hypothetical protein